mgnify:CR=1 FL=1
MTAQNSANKSVFYKFLPYYLNKVKYLRPQLIMSIIFSVLSYPAFMHQYFMPGGARSP